MSDAEHIEFDADLTEPFKILDSYDRQRRLGRKLPINRVGLVTDAIVTAILTLELRRRQDIEAKKVGDNV